MKREIPLHLIGMTGPNDPDYVVRTRAPFIVASVGHDRSGNPRLTCGPYGAHNHWAIDKLVAGMAEAYMLDVEVGGLPDRWSHTFRKGWTWPELMVVDNDHHDWDGVLYTAPDGGCMLGQIIDRPYRLEMIEDITAKPPRFDSAAEIAGVALRMLEFYDALNREMGR